MEAKIPAKVNVMSSLLVYAQETNVLLNVMTDVLVGIRTKDMDKEEKDKYMEKIDGLLKDYRERSNTFLIEAKD